MPKMKTSAHAIPQKARDWDLHPSQFTASRRETAALVPAIRLAGTSSNLSNEEPRGYTGRGHTELLDTAKAELLIESHVPWLLRSKRT